MEEREKGKELNYWWREKERERDGERETGRRLDY